MHQVPAVLAEHRGPPGDSALDCPVEQGSQAYIASGKRSHKTPLGLGTQGWGGCDDKSLFVQISSHLTSGRVSAP